MEKIIFLAWILVVSTSTILQVQSKYYSKSHPYKPATEKKTNLHFYVHDILSGKKQTGVQIAGAKSATYLMPFGSTFVTDSPITKGPEITSRVIGNSRGMYVWTSQDRRNPDLVMYVDFGFTRGMFSGSSLSLFSRYPLTEEVVELAFVGGRGKFRMARGFALVKIHYLNATNGVSVVEFNAEIVHH